MRSRALSAPRVLLLAEPEEENLNAKQLWEGRAAFICLQGDAESRSKGTGDPICVEASAYFIDFLRAFHSAARAGCEKKTKQIA